MEDVGLSYVNQNVVFGLNIKHIVRPHIEMDNNIGNDRPSQPDRHITVDGKDTVAAMGQVGSVTDVTSTVLVLVANRAVGVSVTIMGRA